MNVHTCAGSLLGAAHQKSDFTGSPPLSWICMPMQGPCHGSSLREELCWEPAHLMLLHARAGSFPVLLTRKSDCNGSVQSATSRGSGPAASAASACLTDLPACAGPLQGLLTRRATPQGVRSLQPPRLLGLLHLRHQPPHLFLLGSRQAWPRQSMERPVHRQACPSARSS